jgi:hypothetical protein
VDGSTGKGVWYTCFEQGFCHAVIPQYSESFLWISSQTNTSKASESLLGLALDEADPPHFLQPSQKSFSVSLQQQELLNCLQRVHNALLPILNLCPLTFSKNVERENRRRSSHVPKNR